MPRHVLPVRQHPVVLDEPERAGDAQLAERAERLGTKRRLGQTDDQVRPPLAGDLDERTAQHVRELALKSGTGALRYAKAA